MPAPHPSRPVVAARVLGPARVTVDGADAPSELLWRKHLALLVYLARSPGRRRTREHLVGLLWSDRDEKQARHSLSEALRVFRRVLGEDRVFADVDQVGLSAEALQLDCDDFSERQARGDWAGAAALVSGAFLEGLSVPGANGFEDWVAAERAAWRVRGLDALLRSAEASLAEGDPGRATAAAQRALALDRASELAARAAMRALVIGGDRGGALRVVDELSRVLRHELGTAPAAETLRLADRIREARVGWRLPAAPLPALGAGQGAARPPLFGRERELAALVGAWHRAQGGKGQVVLLEGEPGQGKTRLLEELVARARLDEATVAVLRAVPADQPRPWSGVTGLLGGGLGDAPGIAAAPPAALVALGGLEPDFATRFSGGAASPPMPVPAAFVALVRAAAAERPVLIMFDDAQSLDAETVALLVQLARDTAGAPVLIAIGVTTGTLEQKTGRFDDLRARLGRDLAGVASRLEAIDSDALRALVGWGLPAYDGAATDRLVRRLEQDTAGIPLLAVSVVEAVAGGLRLSSEPSAWPSPKRTLVDTLPGDLPPAVIGSVCARFQQLPEETRHVLAGAAALGGRVDAAGLARVTGLPRQRVEPALDSLEWNRWLVADARGYNFAAPIEREILLQEMITPGQARRYRETQASPEALG